MPPCWLRILRCTATSHRRSPRSRPRIGQALRSLAHRRRHRARLPHDCRAHSTASHIRASNQSRRIARSFSTEGSHVPSPQCSGRSVLPLGSKAQSTAQLDEFSGGRQTVSPQVPSTGRQSRRRWLSRLCRRCRHHKYRHRCWHSMRCPRAETELRQAAGPRPRVQVQPPGRVRALGSRGSDGKSVLDAAIFGVGVGQRAVKPNAARSEGLGIGGRPEWCLCCTGERMGSYRRPRKSAPFRYRMRHRGFGHHH